MRLWRQSLKAPADSRGFFHGSGSGSVVTQLSDGAVVQAAFVGVALGPGHLLGVHIRGFTLVSCGVALSDHGLMAALLLLAMPHPFHKQGLALRET